MFFSISLFPLKESLTLFQIWFFLLTFNYFVPFGIIENKFIKIKSKYFNGNCDYSSCLGWWILFLYEPPHKGLAFLKIICILLRQVISHRKMVVLSLKFTILISWSPVCIPLILLSALMKLTSTSATILYNSMENRHPLVHQHKN